jgi:SAM-dependent methyltransferase
MTQDAAATHDVYARNAARFDADRDKSLFERSWLERFCAHLPSGAAVLDIGCGTGEPIARFLIGKGFAVTGVDFAQSMLDIAARRFPSAAWLRQDMRRLSAPGPFDGVIAWHSFFHLPPDDQLAAFPGIAAHLAPSGVLMMTVGPEEGEIAGRIADEPVYHASLGRFGYVDLIARSGLHLLDFVCDDQTCGGATVLIAKRPAAERSSPCR